MVSQLMVFMLRNNHRYQSIIYSKQPTMTREQILKFILFPNFDLILLEKIGLKYLQFLNLSSLYKITIQTLMQDNLNYKIYWEKQGVDSLCGVHCINSLLQGPFFDEIQLSNIALQLDRKENQLMAEQGVTNDYMKFMKQQSGNVALDGNYSIQVLQQGLKKFELQMISIQTINQKENLSDKIGFICNSSAHWLTIRKIKGIWYNLNSLGMRLPEIISDFYLSAFLIAVKQSGYQIFSIQGNYPESNENSFEQYNSHQEWYPAKRVKKYHEKKSKRKGYKPNISGGNDNQMQKAIALSLGKKYDKYKSSGEDSDWENDKPKPPKPFAGKPVSMGDNDFAVLYDKFSYDEEDAQLITIMKMTLQQKFKVQPETGITVTFRFSDGKKHRRVFDQIDLIQSLYDYLWMNKDPRQKFYLVDVMSKEKLVETSIPLVTMTDDNQLVLSVNDI